MNACSNLGWPPIGTQIFSYSRIVGLKAFSVLFEMKSYFISENIRINLHFNKFTHQVVLLKNQTAMFEENCYLRRPRF